MWKLNNIRIHKQWIKEEIIKETRKYFKMNENETQYIKNLRDTGKTVFRATYIALC